MSLPVAAIVFAFQSVAVSPFPAAVVEGPVAVAAVGLAFVAAVAVVGPTLADGAGTPAAVLGIPVGSDSADSGLKLGWHHFFFAIRKIIFSLNYQVANGPGSVHLLQGEHEQSWAMALWQLVGQRLY